MASLHDRMARAVASIATAASVQRTRTSEAARAARGATDAEREARLRAVVVQLEAAAGDLWAALDEPPPPALSHVA